MDNFRFKPLPWRAKWPTCMVQRLQQATKPLFLYCVLKGTIFFCDVIRHRICDRLPLGPFLVKRNDNAKVTCLFAGALWFEVESASFGAAHTCHSTACLCLKWWNRFDVFPIIAVICHIWLSPLKSMPFYHCNRNKTQLAKTGVKSYVNAILGQTVCEYR